MVGVDLLYRVYIIEPKIKKRDTDIDINLVLVELNDGLSDCKNKFESQEEALFYLQNSSNIKPDREYLILPSCKIQF